ncbi:MAG: hypothetical protein AAF432_01775 [Planctomycetota bacterium]
MKFFTYDWWRHGKPALVDDPAAAYASHYAACASRLPPDVRRLHDDIALHDAIVKSLTVDPDANVLTTTLVVGDLQVGYSQLEIDYVDLSRFDQRSYFSEKGAPSSSGLDELAFHECDVDGELFVHRFLFWSGIEWCIRCRDMRLSLQEQATRFGQ